MLKGYGYESVYLGGVQVNRTIKGSIALGYVIGDIEALLHSKFHAVLKMLETHPLLHRTYLIITSAISYTKQLNCHFSLFIFLCNP